MVKCGAGPTAYSKRLLKPFPSSSSNGLAGGGAESLAPRAPCTCALGRQLAGRLWLGLVKGLLSTRLRPRPSASLGHGAESDQAKLLMMLLVESRSARGSPLFFRVPA